MPLLALPNETLLHILHYLRPYVIERVARAFNKRLTRICLPLLADRVRAVQNDRKMMALYPAQRRPQEHKGDCCGTSEHLHHIMLHTGPYSIPIQTKWPLDSKPRMDDLELAENYRWLSVLPELAGQESYLYGPDTESNVSDEDVDILEENAARLGLTLPEGFITFMTSLELQNRLTSAAASSYSAGRLWRAISTGKATSTPHRCPKLDGYTCKFYTDTLPYVDYHLYLDRTGGHCIIETMDTFAHFYDETSHAAAYDDDDRDYVDEIMSESESQSHLQRHLTPLEKEMGLWVVDDRALECIRLYTTSFEEFLVRRYFEDGVSRYAMYKGELPCQVKEYLARIYPPEIPKE